MMQAYLGMTLAQYIQPPTCTVADGTALLAAYNRTINPCTRFWVDGPLDLNASVGSADRPVLIAARSLIDVPGGNNTLYGVVYSDSSWVNNGSGTGNIIGALIIRGSYYGNGTGSVVYNQGVLSAIGNYSDVFIRVPGSWRDF
jgi:hypothetical protein